MDGTNLSDVESATRSSDPEQPSDNQEPDNPETLFFPNQRKSQGNSGTPVYGALLATVSTRKWGIRLGVAVAVTAVFGFLTSEWAVSATLGIVVMIAWTIYSSRRDSEVPRWRRSSSAQRRTEVQLKVMKQLGYRVLHARSVPGGNGQIDHFIVGRRGAFAIDSESWDKRLPLRNKLEKLYHGRFSKNERIDEALEEAKRAEELISAELGRDIKVRASLAIYGPGMSWDSHRLRGVDIISGTKVRKWLRTGRDRLTEIEIEEIHQAAKKALPARY